MSAFHLVHMLQYSAPNDRIRGGFRGSVRYIPPRLALGAVPLQVAPSIKGDGEPGLLHLLALVLIPSSFYVVVILQCCCYSYANQTCRNPYPADLLLLFFSVFQTRISKYRFVSASQT